VKFLVLLLFSSTVYAADPRYCGPPTREPDGDIKRSLSVRASFVKLYPCPATSQVTGSCPGWQVDHVIPLKVGGCDAVVNMQWLPIEIKTCKLKTCKDRWELEVYKKR
jgi:hypothetical protein